MDLIRQLSIRLGDFVFGILSFLSPGWSLVVISIAAGPLMLLVWRYTSNQKAIAAARKQISAHLIATRLFKDNLAVTFRAQVQILKQSARIMLLSLPALAIMMVPFILICVQIGLRYEFRLAPVGSPTRLTVTVRDSGDVDRVARELRIPEGVAIDRNDPCRAEPLRTIDWRITPARAGSFDLRFDDDSTGVKIPFAAGDSFQRISKARGGGFWNELLYSAEPSISSGPIESIAIEYPRRSTPLAGWDIHWLVTFLVVSIISALVFKPLLKVHV